jgi:hypothetical protein
MRIKSPILVLAITFITFFATENGPCQDNSIQLKDLIGIWKPDSSNDNLSSVIKFGENGTYRIAYNVERLDTRPIDKGQFKLEGEHITFIPSESPACKTNTGEYTIKMTEKGNFEFTRLEDPCDRRRCLFGRELIRINP